MLGRNLKGNEPGNANIQRVGNAAQIVDAHTDAARFDAPYMRFAAANHERKSLLGESLLNPALPNGRTKGKPFFVGIHFISVCGILSPTAS